MDNSCQVLENHGLVMDHDRILAVGTLQDLKQQYPQATRLDLPDQLLMPGLINMHCHAAMNLLRGAADDLPLHEWLQNRIWPLEGALADAEFVHDGSLMAQAEMLANGITTVNDMYFFPEQAAQAALSTGIRLVAGIVVIEFPTRYASTAQEYIDRGLKARDLYKGETTLHWAVAPHAPYTVSDDTFVQLAALAEELDLPIHCHLHETASEVSDAVARTGERPFERLNRLGLVNERLLAVHGVHLNEHELQAMAQQGSTLVHCPSSNLKLASGFAPTAHALALGVNVTVGTDGAASNNKLDLWEEGRLASLLAKGHSGDATAWPAEELLKSLTCNAARALGLEQVTGRLVAGLAADMISIAVGRAPHQLPLHNWPSKLAYSGSARDVEHVWVAGKQVVHAQQFTGNLPQLVLENIRKTERLWQTRVEKVGA